MHAMAPMHIALPTVTYPQAGVMATKPMTTPLHVPTTEGSLPSNLSKNIHVIIPAAAAVFVVQNTWHAKGPALRADPALNPSHPNQNSAVPRRTKGMLPLRLPRWTFLLGPRNMAPARAE